MRRTTNSAKSLSKGDCWSGSARMIVATVVGYPYSQAWYDRRGVYRAAAHTDRPAHAASPQGVKFAPDSPLEEAVSSEPVSEAKFPASWENTGNFVRRGL